MKKDFQIKAISSVASFVKNNKISAKTEIASRLRLATNDPLKSCVDISVRPAF